MRLFARFSPKRCPKVLPLILSVFLVENQNSEGSDPDSDVEQKDCGELVDPAEIFGKPPTPRVKRTHLPTLISAPRHKMDSF